MGFGAADATPLEQLAATLSDDLADVNALISDRLSSERVSRISEVTSHIVGAGGKRLRPMLTLAAARLLGYDGTRHVPLATAVEFIHTATLLHDDVVDESTRRRGGPTANLLWDNKSSILVGDYLFARAFQLMVSSESLAVLGILSNAAATITEGEVLQLVATRDLGTTIETYLRIVRGKTAALFSAATEAGATVAGGTDVEVAALRAYGDALGVAFQMTDDLLDYGDGDIGKNTGDDLREGKMTLPVILALSEATGDEKSFWSRTVGKARVSDADIDEARAILERRGALDETRKTALAWSAKAKTSLAALPDHPLRGMLSNLADHVVARII